MRKNRWPTSEYKFPLSNHNEIGVILPDMILVSDVHDLRVWFELLISQRAARPRTRHVWEPLKMGPCCMI